MGRAKMGQSALTAWVEDTIDKSLTNKQRRKNEKNRYNFIYIHINSYDVYIFHMTYIFIEMRSQSGNSQMLVLTYPGQLGPKL